MNLLSRLRGEARSTLSLSELVAWQQFVFGGHSYPLGLNTTMTGSKGEEFAPGLEPYVRAMSQSPPAFGAQLVRSLILAQARFTFRDRVARNSFGGNGLRLLERPWRNGTTGQLITRMEWHAGAAGNSFVYRRRAVDELKVVRPDWVVVIHGSHEDPDEAGWALDRELLGYAYYPGGVGSRNKPRTMNVEDVAHWMPIPDPMSPALGMSWLTPVIREIQGDIAATTHKLKFFEQGATPNLVVTGLPAEDETKFRSLVKMLGEQHDGVLNAYKTLYLSTGADATVVGSNLKDLDLKGLQGGHETRIAVASRVPAPVLGISEGLAGSSLNAGNYGQARRNLADGWMYPTLQDMCGALSPIIDKPNEQAELWFDTLDMPFVREDEKDAADIRSTDAQTLKALVDAGYDPDAAVAFLQGRGDLSELVGKHSGLFSVQLQPPGTETVPDSTEDSA